jgi:serine protease AprX
MTAAALALLATVAAVLPQASARAVAPAPTVEVVVQMEPGAAADPAALVTSFGGRVTRDLHIIHGVGALLTDAQARALAAYPGVRAISPNAPVEPRDEDYDEERYFEPRTLATSFNQSIRADRVWRMTGGGTGKGVTVAVVDTGIAGALPDFRVSAVRDRSRVVATAVVNPDAKTAGDSYGHGTHVAGLIAGNGRARSYSDPLDGRYVGVARHAKLVSVKVSDEDGQTTVIDVIDGLQFVVDKKDELGIDVVNLSLNSTWAESYRTDPLAAAAEQAWFAGLVVVTAAGNRGAAPDAVHYAPANDPFVLVVGAVDDAGTKDVEDDVLAPWSSRGTSQDGLRRPDVLAPGARLVSTLAPGSRYAELCPTCVVDGQYFRVGGTSMATAVVSGAAAALLELHPLWTPNQVKAALVHRVRDVPGAGGEIALDKAHLASPSDLVLATDDIPVNDMIDRATGSIDWTRASWSRASWSEAADPLRASWSRASWSRASWSRASWSSVDECVEAARASWSGAAFTADDEAGARAVCVEWERASWSRASWSRASWSRASWSRASWSTSFYR